MALAEDSVREALKQVIDPELYVNIVDLGLIYVVNIGEEDEDLPSFTQEYASYRVRHERFHRGARAHDVRVYTHGHAVLRDSSTLRRG